MRSPAVTTWTAAAVGTVAVAGAAIALFFNNAPAENDSDSTEVGGVTVTAPGDISDFEPADPRRSSSSSSTVSSTSDQAPATSADTAASSTSTRLVEAPANQAPAASVASRGGTRPGKPGGEGPGSPLEVKGSVAGLYPGATRYLPLTFENTNSFAVNVVDMAITPSSNGSCASTNLELPQAWTTKRIAANSEETVNVPVRMSSSAGTECAGATFGLAYSGKVVKA